MTHLAELIDVQDAVARVVQLREEGPERFGKVGDQQRAGGGTCGWHERRLLSDVGHVLDTDSHWVYRMEGGEGVSGPATGLLSGAVGLTARLTAEIKAAA